MFRSLSGTTDRNQRKPSEDDNLSQGRDMNPGLSVNETETLRSISGFRLCFNPPLSSKLWFSKCSKDFDEIYTNIGWIRHISLYIIYQGFHIQRFLAGGGGVLIPGWSDHDMKLTTHLHLVPRFRMSGAVPPVHLHDKQGHVYPSSPGHVYPSSLGTYYGVQSTTMFKFALIQAAVPSCSPGI